MQYSAGPTTWGSVNWDGSVLTLTRLGFLSCCLLTWQMMRAISQWTVSSVCSESNQSARSLQCLGRWWRRRQCQQLYTSLPHLGSTFLSRNREPLDNQQNLTTFYSDFGISYLLAVPPVGELFNGTFLFNAILIGDWRGLSLINSWDLVCSKVLYNIQHLALTYEYITCNSWK